MAVLRELAQRRLGVYETHRRRHVDDVDKGTIVVTVAERIKS